jgi:DNA invertase Pin-like site-specific DNA recombinase
MPRVALYARYSSDNQRDASIEDQLRQCREYAVRQGWTVIDSYSDRAISGASLIRPGIQELLSDVSSGRFDTVLSEALDRISRDQEDVAAVFKRLRFAGGLHRHVVGRRDHRASCRAQGHDERPVPERPCAEDPSRH